MAIAVVGRQQRGNVGIDQEQIADGVGVLCAIQPVKGLDPARVGIRGRCPIDLCLEKRDQRLGRRGVRSRPAGGGIALRRSFRITRSQTSGSAACFRHIWHVERQIAALQSLVVAGDTVTDQQRTLRWRRRGRNGRVICCGGTDRRGRQRPEQPANSDDGDRLLQDRHQLTPRHRGCEGARRFSVPRHSAPSRSSR